MEEQNNCEEQKDCENISHMETILSNPFAKVKETLNFFLKKKNIPHIIFHGNSGSGKHTFVCNFINNIYHFDKKIIKTNVMFVNCAHGKGIKFIREDLKFFAKINIQCNSGILFKTIVLINADFLTIDAQTALRRCIEIFSYNTRFFIIVENKHKLLTPILSRFCEIYVPETLEIIEEEGCEIMRESTAMNPFSGMNWRKMAKLEEGCVGESLNLHQLNLNKKMNFIEHENNVEKIIENVFSEYDFKDFKNNETLIRLSNVLYEKGISCWAFIKYLKKYKKIVFKNNFVFRMNEIEKITDILMEYDAVKSEFKCEKLLFYYIFNFI